MKTAEPGIRKTPSGLFSAKVTRYLGGSFATIPEAKRARAEFIKKLDSLLPKKSTKQPEAKKPVKSSSTKPVAIAA